MHMFSTPKILTQLKPFQLNFFNTIWYITYYLVYKIILPKICDFCSATGNPEKIVWSRKSNKCLMVVPSEWKTHSITFASELKGYSSRIFQRSSIECIEVVRSKPPTQSSLLRSMSPDSYVCQAEHVSRGTL